MRAANGVRDAAKLNGGCDFFTVFGDDELGHASVKRLDELGEARVRGRVARQARGGDRQVRRCCLGLAFLACATGQSTNPQAALFEQAGVIRTDTMHELFDVASDVIFTLAQDSTITLSARPSPFRISV